MVLDMTETSRIKEAYARRKEVVPKGLYSYFNYANLFIIHGRERAILNLLDKYGMNPLANKVILDLGCGVGGELRNFIRYGALPQNLYGIDLLEDKIEQARMFSPNIDFRLGNAEELPYEDGSFDMVMQFTVFTSILDDEMKRNIANEMLRVLSPDGIILWYDYFVSKPTNPDVKGVGKREMKRLFPNCSFDFNRVTLAPPIARLIAPWSFLV
ncbi:MAG: class I SAM-dependent methyltransferase, partial [Candidatus Omnitrophica bacterium]|nr:class I SAM-dependent methyltransferase [Candidatus Omnitrophota bacterium]